LTGARNLGASVRARLLNKARAESIDYNLVLTRFALERWLYRLSISRFREEFLLKGALLFDLWFDVPHRPTRDADLLGAGTADIPRLITTFQELCAIDVEDAIEFQPQSVRAEGIRKEGNYPGIRITLVGLLDGARCPVQVDIGFGDAVTPGPEVVHYPAMLEDMQGADLRAYPRYTVVSEKLEALVALGIVNSRMKDFFDLWILSRQSEFDGETLRTAVVATFRRRSTPMPAAEPIGLSDEFAHDAGKQTQWRGFISKNALGPIALSDVISDLRVFLIPLVDAARGNTPFPQTWKSTDGWKKS
jgi:hypothetical protein